MVLKYMLILDKQFFMVKKMKLSELLEFQRI